MEEIIAAAVQASGGVSDGSSGVSGGTYAFIAAAVSSVGAAVASVAAVLQIQSMRKGVQLQDQAGRVSVLLDVMNRWSNTLPALYEVREKAGEFQNAQAGFEKVTDFMRSDYWAKLRVVCNFYEFVGLLAYNGVLRLETLLVIITVRASDYELAKPSIDRLRQDYRKDIYLFWDWLHLQCNHPDDERAALRAKRQELEALNQHWAKAADLKSRINEGLDPFAPSAKRGL